MGLYKLTEAGIIGEFFLALNAGDGAAWVPKISNYFESDQDIETYPWLGMAPAMREWVGGRNAKGLRENNIEIKNKHYEATIDILVKWLRRDKSDQALLRIRELAQRANTHWASLLSTLIINGSSTVCYDNQYFFDTDHSEGDSGTQSNSISVDISALPTTVHGSTTAPSVEEMQLCIAAGIAQIAGIKDDKGEPMNEGAQSFLVMCPVSLMNAAMQAVATPLQIAASQTALTALKAANFSIEVAPNARLSDWTASFALFNTNSVAKALIRQEETAVDLKIKGEGSEYAFDNDAHQYGIDTWRNVGYGMWQKACLVTMT
jgi:phage major head subunit gpT-like protein